MAERIEPDVRRFSSAFVASPPPSSSPSFGEIMCWFGIFLSASSVFNANTNAAFVSILSPLFTAFLLLFLSGIPLGEARYDAKYGHLEEYIQYKRDTSPLIPMPTCLYRALPNFARLFCCCEFARYSTMELTVGVRHTEDGAIVDGRDGVRDGEAASKENDHKSAGYQATNVREGANGTRAPSADEAA
jgi:hypothetical protein